jgi:predicted TIM-barrel fold metal-dependent hydrolase
MHKDLSNTFVDCHFHVFDAGVATAQARYVPQYAAPLSHWRGLAEPCGVGRGVLVQTSFLGVDNSRLLRELAAHPDQLRGVAVLAPDADPQSLAALDAAGVRGLRLNLAQVSHDMGHWRRASSLWDAMLALGWHLELHTDVGALAGVLRDLPAGLPLVLDHMGKPGAVSLRDPSVAATVRRAQQSPVHVKLSGTYRLEGRDPAALTALWLAELGAAQLLWGSDWPWTNHEGQARYPDLLAALRTWLGDAAAERVLAENPSRLYWRETT